MLTGGYNVYPKEVELAIDALPGVAESAVYGIPDPDLGEAVAAAVVLRPGAALDAAGVIAALRERIAHFKVPRRVVFLDELPRNAMGKVRKGELRAACTSEPPPSSCGSQGQAAGSSLTRSIPSESTPHVPGPPHPSSIPRTR